MTIIEYQNGNCAVTIDTHDGTKTRSCAGVPRPEFPESIDLKLTERCDQGCEYCHESAMPDGRHCRSADVLRIVKGLPAGVEIAVGGGATMSHPEVELILHGLKHLGLIANITLHIEQAMKHGKRLRRLRDACLVYGLGLSGCAHTINFMEQIVPELCNENTVLHAIAGIGSPCSLRHLTSRYKVLILGFKRRGRGREFYGEKVERSLGHWEYCLPVILAKENLTISFDNLALEQLHVRRYVRPEVWRKSYMGHDGQFSMFVDAVRMEYAASSADELRRPLGTMTIREAFGTLVTETKKP